MYNIFKPSKQLFLLLLVPGDMLAAANDETRQEGIRKTREKKQSTLL